MIGREGIGMGATRQEMHPREGMTGPRPLHQEFEQVAHLIAEEKEEQAQQGNHPPFPLTPNHEAAPEHGQGQTKIGLIGYNGHQEIKEPILPALINQIE
jgi:hypothetical protein